MGNKATYEQLGRHSSQANILYNLLKSGVRSTDEVQRAMQLIIEGKFPTDAGFDRYLSILRSPFESLRNLEWYNAKYWNNRFSTQDFSRAQDQLTRVPSGHIQRVNDLIGFHVEFDSPAETFNMWIRVYQGELPILAVSPELKFDDAHYHLQERTRIYKPGIHLIGIDLAAHWDPTGKSTLEDVMMLAGSEDEILAQLEVLSVYGVQTQLLVAQDGTNLPFAMMRGVRVFLPDSSRNYNLCLFWDTATQKGVIGVKPASERMTYGASPVIKELP